MSGPVSGLPGVAPSRRLPRTLPGGPCGTLQWQRPRSSLVTVAGAAPEFHRLPYDPSRGGVHARQRTARTVTRRPYLTALDCSRRGTGVTARCWLASFMREPVEGRPACGSSHPGRPPWITRDPPGSARNVGIPRRRRRDAGVARARSGARARVGARHGAAAADRSGAARRRIVGGAAAHAPARGFLATGRARNSADAERAAKPIGPAEPSVGAATAATATTAATAGNAVTAGTAGTGSARTRRSAARPARRCAAILGAAT